MSVRVRVLGSGDAFGSGGRLQTCILVESPAGLHLLDCGASSLIALKQAGVDPNDIDAMVISHLHGDHFGGIPFFVLDGQFARRSRRLTIAGPPGVRERATQAMELFFPGSSTARRAFETEFVELAAGAASDVHALRVTPYEVVHPCGAPAYALRVAVDGRVIVYSGDTEWTDRLVEAADGADLFLCEAYFYDKRVRTHLDYATVIENRERLRCKRLVVTHMSADMLGRLSEVAVEAAHDGFSVVLE